MKRSWITLAAALVIVTIIAVTAALQYRWLVRASEAERDRMQKRVNTDTEHFAADFNQEIQGIYFNFQIDASSWKNKDWSEFNARYDFWRGKTAYPEIVSNYIFVENRPDAEPLVYNAEQRQFIQGEIPEAFNNLRSKLSSDADFRSVYPDVPALVIPIHAEPAGNKIEVRPITNGEIPRPSLPPHYGFLVAMLNKEILTARVMPELVNKYFSDGEYRVSIVSGSGIPEFENQAGDGRSDAKADLFDLSADKMVLFAGRDLIPGEPGSGKREVFVSQKVEGQTVTRSIDTLPRGRVRIEMSGEKPRTAVLERTNSSTDGHWLLSVQHRAGSLQDFIDGQRRRDLGFGSGLLVLLAGGISIVYLSAQKVRRYAQRQVDFVSSVSHEFRTPIAVICSAGENLEDGVASEPQQVEKYGHLIRAEGRKLSQMVEQVLDFAGANSGQLRYKFERTNISDIIGDAIAGSREATVAEKADIDVSVPPGLPTINADREALARAVQYLISNAAKYGGEPRRVWVTAANGDGNVKISVRDEGIGISKHDLRHVFDPFFRAKSVVDAQIHGNGLGLSVVKQTVEAHGGRVRAESENGAGSTFTIELPISN
jgi:signal transduction histidine kinase